MSKDAISIGDAELEIMKVIWCAAGPISSSEITRAVEGYGWKRTTVATFLARLVDKGALWAEKRGKTMYYTAAISAAEYKKSQVKSLVKNVFDGSARELVASLFEEEPFSEEAIAELRAIFEDKE